MRRTPVAPLALLCLTLGVGAARAESVGLPLYPSISPDGREVVFSWRGDLWKVPAAGGQALRLTTSGRDLRSAWSPDGRWIAFDSERTGSLNLFVMGADGTGVRQVTRSDQGLVLSGWGPDDRWLLLHARDDGDVYKASRPYAVRTAGGPLRRLHGAFGHHPVASPDGRWLAFVRGESSWARRGYRGPDARELWLHDLVTGAFLRLTDWRGNDGMPRWAGRGRLLFASDRELETTNLWALDLDEQGAPGAPRRLTAFTGQDLQGLDVAADGSRAVLLVWDTLYTLDLTDPDAAPRPLEVMAGDDATRDFALRPLAREVSEAALSPDGKTMAFVALGEVWVRSTRERAAPRRVTATAARERDLAWSPCGTRLYFASDADGTWSIRAAEVELTREELRQGYARALQPAAAPPPGEPAAAGGEEEEGEKEKKDEGRAAARWQDGLRFRVLPVVETPHHDTRPDPSPDGRRLAFCRGRGDLVVRDLEGGAERTLLAGWDPSLHWRWSPDGRALAYAVQDRDFNSDVWVVPADGGAPATNVTMHPGEDAQPRWSGDGKVLAFLSSRVGGEADVWMVHLDRKLDGLNGEERLAYYEEAAKAARGRKPLEPGSVAPVDTRAPALDLEDAYLRLRRVTAWPGDEGQLELTPAGDRLVFRGRQQGESGLFSARWDGDDVKRLAGPADVQHLTLGGDKLVFVSGGRAALVPVSGGGTDWVELDATLRVDLAAQSTQKFLEAARILAQHFYHPTLKGLDWPALTARYLELARRARTAHEFDWAAERLLGELNASHLGVSPPSAPAPEPLPESGRLGVDREPVAGGFRVTGLLERGPAQQSATPLEVGDLIVAVEGEPLEPEQVLEERLVGRVGQETTLTVRRALPDGREVELLALVTPTSRAAERDLRYDLWQRANARKVAEWSGGRLGYLHIRGMDGDSLVEFERDLYAAAHGKLGLLIDVRNNGGGWTADRVLASIMARPHAYTVPRGADPTFTHGYPRDRLFIQRYTRPIALLCNEKSFSNAEILAHAVKTLGRGPVIGEETYGGVISTGSATLVDGTRVRVPFRGWYLPDGTDMENHGAVPDIRVPQEPEDEVEGYDRQLQVATEELLRRLE